MYLVALFAFVFAALTGLFMAYLHATGKPSGKALGIAHGLWAVSGLVLLGAGLGMLEAGPGWWVLVGFLVVAAGGAYLFSRQLQGEPWPWLVIAAHGGLALVMIAVLGVWLAGRDEPPSAGGDVPAATTENEPIPVEELAD